MPSVSTFILDMMIVTCFQCCFNTSAPLHMNSIIIIITPSLDPENQCCLTLVGWVNASMYLAFSFQCQKKRSPTSCINFLYHEFLEMPTWPSRVLDSFYAPSDFKWKFPSTHVIIDGTEIPIQRPKQPTLQQATYST